MTKNSKAFTFGNDPGAGNARAGDASITAFTFGDAESVLDRRDLLDYVECYQNGKWYEPPINLRSLARVLNAGSHHRSALGIKKNLLATTFQPSPRLNRAEFTKFAFDFLVMGNGYLERIDNRLGQPLRLERSLALYTRRGVEAGSYFFLRDDAGRYDPHEYRKGTVFHLMEDDVSQELYGLPEYLSALQSIFLNEAATLFRRRYYINGAHAGFVFYLSEPTMNDEDVEDIRQQLRGAKGVGNFKNLFIHASAGKKDGVQIMPIADVAAKDEFTGVKNTSRDDVLAAHRVPPQLLGVVPQTAGGFGDVQKAAVIFFKNEIEPLQMRMLEINDWLGVEAVRFNPYDVSMGLPVSSGAESGGRG